MQPCLEHNFFKKLKFMFKICFVLIRKLLLRKSNDTFDFPKPLKYNSFKQEFKLNNNTSEQNLIYTQENLVLLSKYLANEEAERTNKTYKSTIHANTNPNIQAFLALKELLYKETNYYLPL
jgi:hypothetical protein